MNLLIPFPTAPPSPLGNAFLAFSETFSRSKLANQATCDAMFRTNERATVLVLEAFVYHVCRANRPTLVSLVSAVTNHYAVILCCPLLHLTQWSVCRRFFFLPFFSSTSNQPYRAVCPCLSPRRTRANIPGEILQKAVGVTNTSARIIKFIPWKIEFYFCFIVLKYLLPL